MNSHNLPFLNFFEWERIYERHLKSNPQSARSCDTSRGGSVVISPFDIVEIERQRREIRMGMDIGRSVPTDVFCYGIGEPELPYCTKIGGVPYRPSVSPWPVDDSGSPMTFIAQLCFAESRDIVTNIPNDVLLMFASDPDIFPSATIRNVHFEWHPLGVERLLTPNQVPVTGWTIRPFFGCRHRSEDFIDPIAESTAEHHCGEDETWWNLFCWEGTKIGGSPMWIQPFDVPTDLEFQGRFLGAIGSIESGSDRLFPFVNREVLNLPAENYAKSELLYWGDSGMVYLSIDLDGDVHWTSQCY